MRSRRCLASTNLFVISVSVDEMTVESEVPTDILTVDLEMTSRTDITHNTVEGIMFGWNRLVYCLNKLLSYVFHPLTPLS